MADKIDSNLTGLRFAEEATLRVLPGTGGVNSVWYPLEPNSYKDLGGQISTIARNPINASRQRKKGVTTDLDAGGGFVQDLTMNNTTRLLQGFFFADAREKPTTAPLATAKVAIASVVATTKKFAATGMPAFKVGALVLASGFSTVANNGIKTVGAITGADVTVVEVLVDEAAPPVAAKLETIGHTFAVGTVAMGLNGNLARMNITGGLDATTLGLIPGEWVFVGGDLATDSFTTNPAGFARINVIAAGYIEFDKTDWTPVVEAGTGITLKIFTGLIIKNEFVPGLIKRRTYHVERTLGNDTNGVMSEYLVGAVPNELTLNMPMADKITADMTFVAMDNEQRSGLQGVKLGTRIVLPSANAFNTSNDFSRIKLASVSATDANPVPLFAFATEMTITINNNVSPNKALGVLGAFDTTAGTFEVGGKITAYFSSIAAVQAVRDNADITLDIAMVKDNAGLLLDIPLLSLGDGRLAVEQDTAIMVPLENMAAESKFGHTLLFMSFPYLPTTAM